MTQKYKKWVLKDFPGENFPRDLSCYEYVDGIGKGRPLKEGEVRVQVIYASVDPVSRVWISGAKSYLPAIKKGDEIPSFAVGTVIESQCAKLKSGDFVLGVLSWSEYWVGAAADLNLLPFVKSH